MHTTRAKKRLVALLVVHTKQLQALGDSLFPVLARLAVVVNLVPQIRRQRTQRRIIENFCKVRVVVVHLGLNFDHLFHASKLNAVGEHVLLGKFDHQLFWHLGRRTTGAHRHVNHLRRKCH